MRKSFKFVGSMGVYAQAHQFYKPCPEPEVPSEPLGADFALNSAVSQAAVTTGRTQTKKPNKANRPRSR